MSDLKSRLETAIYLDLARVVPLSGSRLSYDTETGVVDFSGSFRPIEIAQAVIAALSDGEREALPVQGGEWRDIASAPEGNSDDGPFFDVIWADRSHRYLPVPMRQIDCFKERGTVKLEHGYPSVTTIFNPQPTHWRPRPAPPAQPPVGEESGE